MANDRRLIVPALVELFFSFPTSGWRLRVACEFNSGTMRPGIGFYEIGRSNRLWFRANVSPFQGW